jgi:hypothetical protein
MNKQKSMRPARHTSIPVIHRTVRKAGETMRSPQCLKKQVFEHTSEL